MTHNELPIFEDLLWATLTALKSRGGSASIRELSESLASDLKLADEVLNVLHKNGPQSEVDYRAAWARTHLKFIGAIDNTSRGIWDNFRGRTTNPYRDTVKEASSSGTYKKK